MKLKRVFKTYKRNIYDEIYNAKYRRSIDNLNRRKFSLIETNEFMHNGLNSKEPFAYGRMGWTECNICWLYFRQLTLKPVYKQSVLNGTSVYSGINAPNGSSLDRFAAIYLSALPFMDLMGHCKVKGMAPLLTKLAAPSIRYTELNWLEPWAAYLAGNEPWTKSLAGKTVLVVHPFARSIESQFAQRGKVKSVADIMPDFNLRTLIPPVTFAQQDNGKPWEANLRALMTKVASIDFDVAIIGCGAYGFPLGAFIKQLGRKAIHLGGATQLLFGIRGKRWDERADHAQLMDEGWVRPLLDERPAGADRVEDACYW